jgi:hypothetical protein
VLWERSRKQRDNLKKMFLVFCLFFSGERKEDDDDDEEPTIDISSKPY